MKQPNCVKVDINGNDIVYTIEKELGIEIVGEKKIKVAIEEDEEPWDVIEEDVDDDILNEIHEAFEIVDEVVSKPNSIHLYVK